MCDGQICSSVKDSVDELTDSPDNIQSEIVIGAKGKLQIANNDTNMTLL